MNATTYATAKAIPNPLDVYRRDSWAMSEGGFLAKVSLCGFSCSFLVINQFYENEI